MLTCPVCDKSFQVDQPTLERHVNAHFDGGVDPVRNQYDVVQPSSLAAEEDNDIEFVATTVRSQSPTLCIVCETDLTLLDGNARNAHVSACLDGNNVGYPDGVHGSDDYDSQESDLRYSDDDGPPLGTTTRKADKRLDGQWNGQVFAGLKNNINDKAIKGDRWWDPVDSPLNNLSLPPNFSPGLIPLINDMLEKSISKGATRSAVLACGGVHIKGSWGFDGTWGCGYRNSMMVMSVLWQLPSYRSVFPKEPSVRSVQNWIEDAWRNGYDQGGRQQLGGKLLGTQKWIGTSDLYAMFSSLGVPCTLYDFCKPQQRTNGSTEKTYKILIRWVKQYFDAGVPVAPVPSSSASDDSTTKVPDSVQRSARLPLILQHAGHSRSIVGYEETSKGSINLLLFDPGKSIPKDVRNAGIKRARIERQNGGPEALARLLERRPPSPKTPKLAELTPERTSTESLGSVREGSAAAEPSSGDEVLPGGWVRRKVDKVRNAGRDKTSGDSDGDAAPLGLNVFRASFGLFSHPEYQVLAVSGGPLLTNEERAARREVRSVVVDA